MEEYIKYSAPKSRVLDRKFIESFNANILCELVDRVGAQYWLPSNPSHQKSLPEDLYHRFNGNSNDIGIADGASDLILSPEMQRVYELDAV